ncbi:MAG: hypothetical protein KME69_14945 [Candidatus Thiodiazotropha sp. (ex Codakia orbicularis)]|nr:hypothetical protein [Candidatus Thiodiazotropha sp. (ex Codakia orbicularis)]
MRRNYAVFIILIIINGLVMADVGNEDLNQICKLTEKGQYKQALEKHLWFHEESKKSPGMAGVRLSYAISAWINLGNKYPPAIEALKEVRDRNKKVLLSGKGSFQNFHDLSSINHGLNDEKDTLELFLIIDINYPEQAKLYYIVAEDLLITHKKYDVCAKYIGDPIIKYEQLHHMRELNLSIAKSDSEMNDPEFLEYADSSFVKGVLNLIEVLVAIDKREQAIEVQSRALSYFSHADIKQAIQ